MVKLTAVQMEASYPQRENLKNQWKQLIDETVMGYVQWFSGTERRIKTLHILHKCSRTSLLQRA